MAGEGEREEGEGEEGCEGEDEGEKEVSMDTSEVPGMNTEGRKLVKVRGNVRVRVCCVHACVCACVCLSAHVSSELA